MAEVATIHQDNREVLRQMLQGAMLPFMMIGILLVMVLPVPPILMDLLLTLSITSGILILMVALYTLQPLDFSTFPTLLLVVTLFRLSLNVASTRLILLNGHEGPEAAGQVIKAFGQFVVQGNYTVGIIVFTILVIINFVVITKGAGRVAEVSARFTLDAMPGKQMSIDADLNAGLIDENQARERRTKIEQEADFYGAMDGASKFVRGDAIAGIIITLVNLVGGLVIGTLSQGLSLADAAQFYTILTVGDGLVGQIPALIISTAAGIIVTRSTTKKTLSENLFYQITIEPRVPAMAAAILFIFGCIPSMPTLFMFAVSGCLGGGAFYLNRIRYQEERQIIAEAEHKALALGQGREGTKGVAEPEKVENLLPLDTLALEVGYGLIGLIDPDQTGDLLERIKSIRQHFALEMGFIVPPLRIRDNLDLKPGGYSIKIRDNQIAAGELLTGHLLAMSPSEELPDIDGVPTREPAFGLPAIWITEREREKAQAAGCTVVDQSTVVATHLTEVIRSVSHELLGRQETQNLINVVKERAPKLVDDLIPDVLSLGTVQQVLRNLLRENVSIRDMVTILETLSAYASQTKDADMLTEFCRQALARTITAANLTEDGRLYIMLLDQQIEETISSSIRQTPQGQYLALDPSMAQNIINLMQEAGEHFAMVNAHPVIVCVPTIRTALRRLTEKFLPQYTILSHNEISQDTPIETLGVLKLD